MKRMIVYRDAGTGRFVTEEYAREHTSTVIRQTIAQWRWIKRMQSRRVRK